MSSGSISLALALVALAGCGPRQLALDLSIRSGGCTPSLAAGGSIDYELTDSAGGDGGGATTCTACLAVDSALDGSDALIAFVRQHAPSCAGIHPNSILGLRLTASAAPNCPRGGATPVAFCIEGPTVLVPDGSGDAVVSMPLQCDAQCATQCVPTTCAAQVKDCGPISDGCNGRLECGNCKPPLKCGGGGVPNVCGR
jgi:hypothetical protein